MGGGHRARRRRGRGADCTSSTSSGSDRSTSPTRAAGTRNASVSSGRSTPRSRSARGSIVFTTGPFAPLTWEEAADALEQALAPVLPRSARARRRLRDRAHELAARRRRVRAHAARRDRSRAATRHRRVHGDERVLGRTRARDHDPRRHRPHPARAGERLQGRHRRVVATPRSRRRRHPDRAHPRRARRRGLRRACSSSSSSATRSSPRVTTPPCRAPSTRSDALLRRHRRLIATVRAGGPHGRGGAPRPRRELRDLRSRPTRSK